MRTYKNQFGDELHMEREPDGSIGLTWYERQDDGRLLYDKNIRLPKEAFGLLLEVMAANWISKSTQGL